MFCGQPVLLSFCDKNVVFWSVFPFSSTRRSAFTFFFDNERISSYAVVYNGEKTSEVYWGTENKAFSAVLSTDTFLASQEERLAEQSYYAYRIARRFDSGL